MVANNKVLASFSRTELLILGVVPCGDLSLSLQHVADCVRVLHKQVGVEKVGILDYPIATAGIKSHPYRIIFPRKRIDFLRRVIVGNWLTCE